MPSYTSEFRESVVRSVLSKECRDAAEDDKETYEVRGRREDLIFHLLVV